MSPLFSLVAPSFPLLLRSTAAARHLQLLIPQSPRCTSSSFHTSARQRADLSSLAADLDFLEDKSKPKKRSQSPSSGTRPTGDIIGDQLNKLLDASFATPNPAKRKPSSTPDESSASMIDSAFQIASDTDPKKLYPDTSRKMLFPPETMTDAGTSRIMSRYAEQILGNTRKKTKRAIRTIRSRPAVGRTIEVVPDKGMDVGRALKMLEISCAVNRVRQDGLRQRFHERPGMKRKRLKSERWRKMFKESFRATVNRVKEMRRKGW